MMTLCKSERSYCVKEPVADSGAVELVGLADCIYTAGSQFAGPLKLQGFSSRDR